VADVMLTHMVMRNATAHVVGGPPLAGSPRPDFAVINDGALRASIPTGPVKYGDVATAFPFANAVVQVPLKGSAVRAMIDGGLAGSRPDTKERVTSGIQVSRGIDVAYLVEEDEAGLQVDIQIWGEPLDDDEVYQVVTVDFVAMGGDNNELY
jgi:5'-nucleotidase